MLKMADSTIVANLPDGFDAYLGYGNGDFNTAADLKTRFPAKPLVILSVKGEPTSCNGVDIEPGNYNAIQGVNAAISILNTKPVIYASVAGMPGYGMPDVLNALRANGIAREKVRLVSAHYTYSPHICGPTTCNAISIPMDGSQYTDAAFGNNNSSIDVSQLNDNFFTEANAMGTIVTQNGWLFCSKCKCLFWGADQASSVCAAGGTHDGTVSFTYAVSYVQP